MKPEYSVSPIMLFMPRERIIFVSVRPARLDDADSIARVHVQAWQAAYHDLLPAEYLQSLSVEEWSANWRSLLEAGVPEVWVAEAHKEIVGWSSFDTCRDEDAQTGTGELWGIYIAASHWSCGLGWELWLAAKRRLIERRFASVTLWVLADNQRAIQFYKRQGFTIDASAAKAIVIGGCEVSEIRMTMPLSD